MKMVILAENDRYIIFVDVVMRADDTCGVESEGPGNNANTYLVPINEYVLDLGSDTANKGYLLILVDKLAREVFP